MDSPGHAPARALLWCLLCTALLTGCRSEGSIALSDTAPDAPATASEQMQFLTRLAVIGCRSIYVDREARIEASIGSQWSVSIDREATIAGNIFNIEGEVLLDRDATVLGDVDAGGPVKLERGASYRGSIVDQSVSVPIASIALPVLPVSSTGTDVTVDNGATTNIPPGAYGNLELKRGGTIRLSSGAYQFEAINIERDSAMSLDSSAGPVFLNVNRQVTIGRDVAITASRNAADSVLLQVAGGDVTVGRNVTFTGSILAPQGTISVDRESTFEGALYAADIKIGRSVRLTGNPSSSLLNQASGGWLGYEECSQEL